MILNWRFQSWFALDYYLGLLLFVLLIAGFRLMVLISCFADYAVLWLVLCACDFDLGVFDYLFCGLDGFIDCFNLGRPVVLFGFWLCRFWLLNCPDFGVFVSELFVW